MAKKNENTASRVYLKVIMGFTIAVAILSLISGICLCFTKIIPDNEVIKMIDTSSVTDSSLAEMNMGRADFARVTLGVVTFFGAAFAVLEAWLIARALKDSRKSTFLLVLSVIGLVLSITGLLTSGFNNVSTVLANIVDIALNGCLFAAIYKIRQEND